MDKIDVTTPLMDALGEDLFTLLTSTKPQVLIWPTFLRILYNDKLFIHNVKAVSRKEGFIVKN